jgi:FixJ family two-component response regulator
MISVLAPNVTEEDALAISDRVLGVVTGSSNREVTDQLTISSDAVTLRKDETLEEMTARLMLALKIGDAARRGVN